MLGANPKVLLRGGGARSTPSGFKEIVMQLRSKNAGVDLGNNRVAGVPKVGMQVFGN